MSTARPGSPRFKGAFHSFSVSVHTNREKGTDSRLFVYSQGSRTAVAEYLWLKFLWDELSRKEFELFLSLTEIINNEKKFATLRAVNLNGKKITRKKLVWYETLLEGKSSNRLRYLGFRQLVVEIYDYQRSLPKVPKFSGWVRSSSSIGSKSPRGSSFLEPLAILENDYENKVLDWYHLLTVGEIGQFPSGIVKSP